MFLLFVWLEAYKERQDLNLKGKEKKEKISVCDVKFLVTQFYICFSESHTKVKFFCKNLHKVSPLFSVVFMSYLVLIFLSLEPLSEV